MLTYWLDIYRHFGTMAQNTVIRLRRARYLSLEYLRASCIQLTATPRRPIVYSERKPSIKLRLGTVVLAGSGEVVSAGTIVVGADSEGPFDGMIPAL